LAAPAGAELPLPRRKMSKNQRNIRNVSSSSNVSSGAAIRAFAAKQANSRPIHDPHLKEYRFKTFSHQEEDGRAPVRSGFFRPLQVPEVVPQDEVDIGRELAVVLVRQDAEFFDDLFIQGKADPYFQGFHWFHNAHPII